MYSFSQARKNMVDCQIHTAGVTAPHILDAFDAVPREKFVPKAYQDISYLGEDLPLGEGRFLLEPSVHARMLQALEARPEDVALDISVSNGYSAAILSLFVTTVVAVDSQKKYLDTATQVWNEGEFCNIAGFQGPLAKGWAAEAPYDVIFMSGAAGEIPEHIVAQLAPGGRLVVVVKPAGRTMGQAMLVRKSSQKSGGYSSYPLFEAGCPYLPGFEPQESFSFS